MAIEEEKFELRGGREMVNGDRARELLIEAPSSPHTIRLSNKSLSLQVRRSRCG